MHPSSLKLPELDPDTVKVFNDICGRSWKVALDDQAYEIASCSLGPTGVEWRYELILQVGHSASSVFLSDHLAKLLLGDLLPLDLLDQIPEEIIGICLNECYGAECQQVSKILEQETFILGFKKTTALNRNTAGLIFVVSEGDNNDTLGHFALPPESSLSQLFAAQDDQSSTDRERFNEIPIVTPELSLGELTLALDDCLSLEPGDVLILGKGSNTLSPVAATLSITSEQQWAVSIMGNNATIENKIKSLKRITKEKRTALVPGEKTKELAPEKANAKTGLLSKNDCEDEDALQDSIDQQEALPEPEEICTALELDIKLRFELPCRNLSLGELEKINQGYVITLDDEASEKVQIYAGSQRIALGDLVSVGERLGVRLNKLYLQ